MSWTHWYTLETRNEGAINIFTQASTLVSLIKQNNTKSKKRWKGKINSITYGIAVEYSWWTSNFSLFTYKQCCSSCLTYHQTTSIFQPVRPCKAERSWNKQCHPCYPHLSMSVSQKQKNKNVLEVKTHQSVQGLSGKHLPYLILLCGYQCHCHYL